MSFVYRAIDFTSKFENFVSDLSDWSQITFGTDQERGPIGPLKHLKKECDEAIANPSDKTEFADMFILLIDAARRAGIKPIQLLEFSIEKMVVNKTERKWVKPIGNEPGEHVK